jgi:hypothetical protein
VFDSILAGLLVILPVASGFVVMLVSSKQQIHTKWRMRWRYALGVVLILFGVLIGVQQSEATKASAREREEAIKETSARVAAETSATVMNAVSVQYQEMMTRINGQIQKLQGQSSGQAKDAERSQKTPPLANGMSKSASMAAFAAPLEGEDIRLFWQQESSTHADALYAAQVTVQANVPVNPVRLAITCDAPLKQAEGPVGIGSGPATLDEGTGIDKENPQTFLVSLTAQGPAVLRPGVPLVFHLYSDHLINIVKFERHLR